MSDPSATAAQHWPGSSRAGSVLHGSCCRNFADRKPRGGGLHPALLLCALVLSFAGTELRAETTIYVGKHFEVRDHDAPVKYAFNGNTRVARVTGSLSANERIQRLRLRAGWNLVSLAVTASNLSAQLQKSNAVTSAYSWNPPASNYVAVVPGVVPAGTVLWINATNNATIGIVGTYTNPVNRALNAGATYLASAGLEAWSPTIPLTMGAWSFNPQPSTLNPQPTWLAQLTGDLSSVNDLPHAFSPGQALYVTNEAPTEMAAPDPALRIRYYHQDHLGSSSVMTDANGALIEETALYPFGETRNEHQLRQIEESYKFTQKERDDESRLHYFESRYLAAPLSRFITPDRKYANSDELSRVDFAGYLAHPQKCNLYAYVNSNPVRFVDPDGRDGNEVVVGVGAGGGGGIGVGAMKQIDFIGIARPGAGGIADYGACLTEGAGIASPGVSLTGGPSINWNGRGSFEGDSITKSGSVGDGFVISISGAESDTGGTTYSLQGGFGAGPPLSISAMRTTTQCYTAEDAGNAVQRWYGSVEQDPPHAFTGSFESEKITIKPSGIIPNPRPAPPQPKPQPKPRPIQSRIGNSWSPPKPVECYTEGVIPP